jgi:hypothetical protein
MNPFHYTELAEALPDDVFFHEWNTYRREVGRLLSQGSEGKFVLIKGQTVIGLFDHQDLALAEGNRRFPCQTFLVHQVQETEPVVRVRGYNLPCLNSPIPSRRPA